MRHDHQVFRSAVQPYHGVFGTDRFGRRAESFARFFGTPGFLIGQSIIVMVWIGLNVAAFSLHWDPYPFILLNLMFSLQAAYAAPLILLAQTRQADRDKIMSEAEAQHREAIAANTIALLEQANRESDRLLELVAANNTLTEEIHDSIVGEHR